MSALDLNPTHFLPYDCQFVCPYSANLFNPVHISYPFISIHLASFSLLKTPLLPHSPPLIPENLLKEGSHIDQDFISSVDESVAQVKKEVIQNLKDSSARRLPDVESLFEDVYHTIPQNLKNQQQQLRQNFESYPEMFPKNKYHFRK